MGDTLIVNPQNPKQNETVITEGTTVPVPTMREAELAVRADKAQADRQALQGEIQDVKVLQSSAQRDLDEAEAAGKAALAEQAKRDEALRKAESARAQEAREHAMAELDEARKRVKDFKYEDFYGDGLTARRVAGGIAVAAGGIGAAIQNAGAAMLGQSGHYQNLAAEALNKAVEDNFKRQHAQLEADKDALVAAGKKAEVVEQFARQKALDIEAEKVMAKERILADTEKAMAAKGLPVAEIKRVLGNLEAKLGYNADVSKYIDDQRHLESPKFRQKRNERQQMTYDPLPEGTTGKPPEEGVRKAAAQLVGAEIDLDALKYVPTQAEMEKFRANEERLKAAGEFGKGPFNAAGKAAGRALGVVPESAFDGLSPKARTAIQAIERFNTWAVNEISGASATPEERANIRADFGIAVDDPRSVKDAKIDRIRKQVDEKRRQLGAYAPKSPVAPAAASAPPSAPPAPVSGAVAPGSIVNVNGQRYRLGADGDTLEPLQ